MAAGGPYRAGNSCSRAGAGLKGDLSLPSARGSSRIDLRNVLRKVLRMSPVSRILSLGRIREAGWPLRSGPPRVCRVAVPAILVTLLLVSCGGSHPRTEVLRSANPTSDVYVRITGPGGAVSYVAQRFRTAAFAKFNFRRAGRKGLFLPPRVRERKLCASVHTIRDGDAPELQKWRGRKLETTVYGKKLSAIFCAALGSALYAGGS